MLARKQSLLFSRSRNAKFIFRATLPASAYNNLMPLNVYDSFHFPKRNSPHKAHEYAGFYVFASTSFLVQFKECFRFNQLHTNKLVWDALPHTRHRSVSVILIESDDQKRYCLSSGAQSVPSSRWCLSSIPNTFHCPPPADNLRFCNAWIIRFCHVQTKCVVGGEKTDITSYINLLLTEL